MMNTKRFMAGAIAILLLAVLAAITSGCSGPSTISGIKTETPPSNTQTQTTTTTTSKAPVPGNVEGLEIYENNDPFQPKVSDTSTSSQPAATQSQTPTTGTPVTTTAQATLDGISGDKQTATISINGQQYANVAVGQKFASSFQLMGIASGSVNILYGDNQYTLALQETITVK